MKNLSKYLFQFVERIKTFKECWEKAFKKEYTNNSKYVSQDYVLIKKITDDEARKYFKEEKYVSL